MKQKFLCVMAEYDSETEEKLKAIQKVLYDKGFIGRQTKGLLNHITLGTFNIAQEEQLIKKVQEASKQMNGFDIRLNSIGLFGLSVLFIAPAVNHELLELQGMFNDNYADGMDWTAHTTLLIDEPKIIQKALPIVAEEFKSFAGRIETISLYEFWPNRFIMREKLMCAK